MLLRHSSSLPDLDASSLPLRSSSYPSYNTILSKHFASSSEEILSSYAHTTPPSQPPLSMHSSSHNQHDKSLVDPWLPAPTSAAVSQSANSILPTAFRPYSLHSASSSAPLDDHTHPRFLHTPGGSSALQSFSSHHQPPISLSRHPSEPNIRAVAAQSGHNYPLPSVTEQRYQQQERRQHRSFQHGVVPSPSSASFSVDRRPSTAAGFATSSGGERRDFRAEPIQGVTAVSSAQGAHNSLCCDPCRS